MRIFVNQQNLIETDPVIDEVSEDILDSLNIVFKLFTIPDDVVVTSSTLTLGYVADGIYRATQPVLVLVNKTIYNAELTVKSGAFTVWYFKGPCKAIIRSKLED